MNQQEPSLEAQATSDAPPVATQGKAGKAGSNRRLVVWLVSAACGMLLLSYASVPLYRVFCQVTGYGGTPTRVAPSATASFQGLDDADLPPLTVRFNGDVAKDLAWDFAPEERSMTVRAGEPYLAWFVATNKGSQGVVGQATFNVTPAKVGKYFHKVQCFCFNEQPLEVGETARLDVQFFVDPQLLRDPETQEVRTITLSYTFHHYEDLPSTAPAHQHDSSTHSHEESTGGTGGTVVPHSHATATDN